MLLSARRVGPTGKAYGLDMSARDFLAGVGLGAEAIAAVDGKFVSAFVRARKPLP